MYISSLVESRLLQLKNPLEYTAHLEQGRSGMIQLDADGRILNFNQAASQICALEKEIVIGQRADIVFQGYGDKFLRVFDMTNQEEINSLNIRIKGRNVCLEIDRLLLAGEGRPSGMVVILNDVSSTYAGIKQLQTVHMLHSLGELAKQLFDIKSSSIGEVESYMRLILARVRENGSSESSHLLKRAINETVHINTVVRELLFMANSPMSKKAGVTINSLLDEAALLVFRGLGGENVNYNKNLANGLPDLYGDANALKQVFINIMQNALEAMTAEGVLTVKSWLDAEKNMIVINIADTGVGIPKDVMERVFEPFYGTKDHHAGLGLAFVERIVQEHHGIVQIGPGERKGTNVLIYLPITGTVTGGRKLRGRSIQ
ncbi:two-component system sensor histidine kinase NtrB [Azotosporobacter soli]|uniref:two-component system sensor histidine kinase NtrB n=1 Tax=Azotosporobacter soli TaxID=3055040 RepID=UPI0031FEF6B8